MRPHSIGSLSLPVCEFQASVTPWVSPIVVVGETTQISHWELSKGRNRAELNISGSLHWTRNICCPKETVKSTDNRNLKARFQEEPGKLVRGVH